MIMFPCIACNLSLILHRDGYTTCTFENLHIVGLIEFFILVLYIMLSFRL